VSTLRVKVRYFTTLRELAGSAEEELEVEDHSTLADVIREVASKYGREAHDYLYHKGESERVDPSIYFLINGMNAKMLSGLNTRLKDGDVIAIIPPIGGG
jgi:MoaD family protein